MAATLALTFQGKMVLLERDRAFQQGQTGTFDHVAFAMEGSHVEEKSFQPRVLPMNRG
jgi:hypothetical protein